MTSQSGAAWPFLVVVCCCCWLTLPSSAFLFGPRRPPTFPNGPPDLPTVVEDAQESGINTIEELHGETWPEKIVRGLVGAQQYAQLSPECRQSSVGVLGNCVSQFLYLSASLSKPIGGWLYTPAVTPDILTREFLEGMPLPPSGRCCKSAHKFQDNMCACDPNTILTFRNIGLFDPLQTIKFANFLYGEQCGARVFVEDDCPNGNPFNQIGNRRLLDA